MMDEREPPSGEDDYGAQEPWTNLDRDPDIPPGYMMGPDGLIPVERRVNGEDPGGMSYADIPLTLREWAWRDLPPRDFLLGSVFTTTTRAMLSAETGIGKTHLGFAIAFAMGNGTAFCHWDARRPARVLIVDGEMSRDLVKDRLAEAEKRAGEQPVDLYILCKEDAEHMPPLDTEEGQAWLDGLISYCGGLDFLILDNVMSLIAGDLKEEEDWKFVIPWMLSLTKRRVGVLWVNHTGHDATRSYGTKTREWQLDTVMIAEKFDDAAADIAMKLTFSKARQRRPETRDDFEPVVLRLKDDVWTSEEAVVDRKRKQGDYALDLLHRAIEEAGDKVPGEGANVRGVSTELWKKYCETFDLSVSDNPDSRGRAFDRVRSKLLDKKMIRSKCGKVWAIQ